MKQLLAILFVLASISLTAQIKVPAASPSSKLEQMVGMTTVTVEYSRPSVKNRVIFANDGLVPFGKVWRTGANAVTKVSFDTDVTVEGNPVAKGDYAILTKPSATSWDIHFYNYEGRSWSSYVEKEPTVKFSVSPQSLPMNVESFTISVDDITDKTSTMNIMWAKTKVSMRMTMDSDEAIVANIEKVLAGPTQNDYYNAASYYHSSGKNLQQALNWIDKATAGDSPKFWQVRRKAMILSDMGRHKEAIAAAEQSLTLAEAAGNEDYIRMNQKSIKEWTLLAKAKK